MELLVICNVFNCSKTSSYEFVNQSDYILYPTVPALHIISNQPLKKSLPSTSLKHLSWRAGEAFEIDCLPVLLLELGKQFHIIRTELHRGRRWEGRRRQRRRGRGSSGLQGRGRGHLASHLTDRVGHRVLHPWESRTQLTSNFVSRHLQRMENYS